MTQRTSPDTARARRAARRQRRLELVAVRATAILDEAGWERSSPVTWREDLGSFVVVPSGGTEFQPVYLGPTALDAVRWARRRRWEANAPRRAAEAKTVGAVIGELAGVALDVLPGMLGR